MIAFFLRYGLYLHLFRVQYNRQHYLLAELLVCFIVFCSSRDNGESSRIFEVLYAGGRRKDTQKVNISI